MTPQDPAPGVRNRRGPCGPAAASRRSQSIPSGALRALGAARRPAVALPLLAVRRFILAVPIVLFGVPGASAQSAYGDQAPNAAEAFLPFGLPVIWVNEPRTIGSRAAVRGASAFATPGGLVAIAGPSGIRVNDAGNGEIVATWLPDPRQEVYSFAVSSAGEIAVGRLGGVEVDAVWRNVRGSGVRASGLPASEVRASEVDASGSRASGVRGEHGPERVRFPCVDACGPVLAVAFSPDGSLLAYQGTRGLKERRQGFGVAVVLDRRTGRPVARLEAVAARAFVAFSPDGRRLTASNVTRFDDTELFGLREWDTSDWSVTANVHGTARRWHAVGRLGDHDFAAAYESDGNLELRDLASGAMIWSVPLVAPSLDADGRSTDGDGLHGSRTDGAHALAKPRLHLVELAPDGRFVLSYESTDGRGGRGAGTLVIRASLDGTVEAMYDAADVTDLSISPDGRTFAYSTRSGGLRTVMAKVPL